MVSGLGRAWGKGVVRPESRIEVGVVARDVCRGLARPRRLEMWLPTAEASKVLHEPAPGRVISGLSLAEK